MLIAQAMMAANWHAKAAEGGAQCRLYFVTRSAQLVEGTLVRANEALMTHSCGCGRVGRVGRAGCGLGVSGPWSGVLFVTVVAV